MEMTGLPAYLGGAFLAAMFGYWSYWLYRYGEEKLRRDRRAIQHMFSSSQKSNGANGNGFPRLQARVGAVLMGSFSIAILVSMIVHLVGSYV